eukprot:COSAG06_NODE_4553_length_4153_cov_321.455599_5_plen_66_part_00
MAIALLKKNQLGDLEGGLALLRETVEAARRNPDVPAEDRELYAEALQQWEAEIRPKGPWRRRPKA